MIVLVAAPDGVVVSSFASGNVEVLMPGWVADVTATPVFTVDVRSRCINVLVVGGGDVSEVTAPLRMPTLLSTGVAVVLGLGAVVKIEVVSGTRVVGITVILAVLGVVLAILLSLEGGVPVRVKTVVIEVLILSSADETVVLSSILSFSIVVAVRCVTRAAGVSVIVVVEEVVTDRSAARTLSPAMPYLKFPMAAK